MSDVQYYQTDGGVIFAYVDGKRELFRLRKTPVIVWEHIASESFEWDQVHQAIFRNHRFDLVQDEDLLQDIPPLPEVVHVQVKPQETFAANDFPYIAAKVKNTRGGRLPLIILLDEDWYESRMGDWESHSLRGVYLDNDEVQLGIDQIKRV